MVGDYGCPDRPQTALKASIAYHSLLSNDAVSWLCHMPSHQVRLSALLLTPSTQS